jgi:hypothetical protein
MARKGFIGFSTLVGIGISALCHSGCGDTTGTVGAGHTADLVGSTSTKLFGSTSTKPLDGERVPTTASSTHASTLERAWTLSAPTSIFGFARIQVPDAMLQKIRAELTKATTPLGVSGTEVLAVYDDPTHDVYLIFAGYNGTGFDPARVKSAFDIAPATTDDGAGDRWITYSRSIDAGPHGGSAGCKSVTAQVSDMAAESTGCLWMTPTTLGTISYYPKPDQQKMIFGTGPDVMGKVMRNLRELVERRSSV